MSITSGSNPKIFMDFPFFCISFINLLERAQLSIGYMLINVESTNFVQIKNFLGGDWLLALRVVITGFMDGDHCSTYPNCPVTERLKIGTFNKHWPLIFIMDREIVTLMNDNANYASKSLQTVNILRGPYWR